jgi:hypothetical protein
MLNSKNEYPWERIPRYCLTDSGVLTSVDSYYQFIPEDNEDEIIIFEYDCADKVLQNELDNCGIESFEFELDLEKLELNDYASLMIPVPTLVKMGVEWSRDDWTGEYDVDYYAFVLERKSKEPTQ